MLTGRCREAWESCSQLSAMRVWYMGCALAFQADETGSSPVSRSNFMLRSTKWKVTGPSNRKMRVRLPHAAPFNAGASAGKRAFEACCIRIDTETGCQSRSTSLAEERSLIKNDRRARHPHERPCWCRTVVSPLRCERGHSGSIPDASTNFRGCSSSVERRSPKPCQSGFNSCLPRQCSGQKRCLTNRAKCTIRKLPLV